jgi:hypothetical protein
LADGTVAVRLLVAITAKEIIAVETVQAEAIATAIVVQETVAPEAIVVVTEVDKF